MPRVRQWSMICSLVRSAESAAGPISSASPATSDSTPKLIARKPAVVQLCRAARRRGDPAVSRLRTSASARAPRSRRTARDSGRAARVNSGSRKITYGSPVLIAQALELVDDVARSSARDSPPGSGAGNRCRTPDSRGWPAAESRRRPAATTTESRTARGARSPRSQRGNGSESRSSICLLATIPSGSPPGRAASRLLRARRSG